MQFSICGCEERGSSLCGIVTCRGYVVVTISCEPSDCPLLAGAISCGCCLGLLVAYSIICCFSLWISLKLHSMYDYAFRLSIMLWCSPRRAVLCVVFMLYYCLLCVLDGSLAVWRYRYLAVAMPGLVRGSLQGLVWTTSLCVMHRVDTPLKVVLLYRSIAGSW